MHALIIEDVALIAWAVEEDLRELGYSTFDSVGTEMEAISAATARCPDLIVADCHLIQGTGWEAVNTMCANDVIPVVFVVGEMSYLSERPWWSVVIGKPYSREHLERAIADTAHRAEIIRGVLGGKPLSAIFPGDAPGSTVASIPASEAGPAD